MKLAIQSYERNGFNDSDGFMIYLDTDNMEINEELFWTTRFYSTRNPSYFCTKLEEWTDDRIFFVKEWLTEKHIEIIRYREDKDINYPDVQSGDVVVLNRPHKNRIKTKFLVECTSCFGSGKWINPRNSSDVRDCFTCSGTGKKASYKYVKGNGSRSFLPGTKFKVISKYVLQRHNTKHITVKGFTNIGQFIQAPIEKLNLFTMRLSDLEIFVQAEYHARKFNLVTVFGGAWVDSNGDYINKAIHSKN